VASAARWPTRNPAWRHTPEVDLARRRAVATSRRGGFDEPTPRQGPAFAASTSARSQRPGGIAALSRSERRQLPGVCPCPPSCRDRDNGRGRLQSPFCADGSYPSWRRSHPHVSWRGEPTRMPLSPGFHLQAIAPRPAGCLLRVHDVDPSPAGHRVAVGRREAAPSVAPAAELPRSRGGHPSARMLQGWRLPGAGRHEQRGRRAGSRGSARRSHPLQPVARHGPHVMPSLWRRGPIGRRHPPVVGHLWSAGPGGGAGGTARIGNSRGCGRIRNMSEEASFRGTKAVAGCTITGAGNDFGKIRRPQPRPRREPRARAAGAPAKRPPGSPASPLIDHLGVIVKRQGGQSQLAPPAGG
jgi:hypothetical protein